MYSLRSKANCSIFIILSNFLLWVGFLFKYGRLRHFLPNYDYIHKYATITHSWFETQCVKERHSFERRLRAPLPKLRAKEECHSFLFKGVMWEWPSYFWGERQYERPSFFTLFFWLSLFFWPSFFHFEIGFFNYWQSSSPWIFCQYYVS